MDQWTEEIWRGRAGQPTLRAVSGHAVRVLPRPGNSPDHGPGNRIDQHRDSLAAARARHPSSAGATLAEDEPVGIRVLVVGDDVLARRGVLAALDGEPGMVVVGEHRTGPAALATLGRSEPDVVLLHGPRAEDVASVLTAVLAVRRTGRAVRVLGIGGRDDETAPSPDGVVCGALPAWATPEQVVAAVRIAAAGFVLSRADQPARPGRGAPSRRTARADGLSERECDVLALVARGRSNAEIAEALTVSVHTVKSHLRNLLGKLGLRDRTNAVIYAFESGLVTTGTTER